jgi:spermidine synthase
MGGSKALKNQGRARFNYFFSISFVVDWTDGDHMTTLLTYPFPFSLHLAAHDVAYGSPVGSAMALLVGVPCGIAVQLVLDGAISSVGVQVPYSKEICDPIRKIVEEEWIGIVEKTVLLCLDVEYKVCIENAI